jgi:hypothetical protein
MNSSSARKRLFVAVVMAIAGCSSSNDSLSPNSVGAKSPTCGQDNAGNVSVDENKAQVAAAVEFTVPATGGSVTVTGKSGIQVDFTVPASAAGKKITFTPTTAAEIGWSDPNFAEVIRMEPDGSKFAEPIVVRPSSKALVVLDFPSSTTKSAPEGLALNAAKDGFLLYHFSTLVVFSPEYNCESQQGWVKTDETTQAATCTDAAFPVLLKLNCLTHPYCMQIDAQCCVAEGETGCDAGSSSLSLTYSRADESGAEYAYCLAQEAETAPESSSVCTQYTTSECTCVEGGTGTHECLKDESGWTECVCQAQGPAVDETGAICPSFHEGDCSVTDNDSCSCVNTDSGHSYVVACDDANCSCKIDDVVTATFAFEAQACQGPEFIREQWFTHCSQGACP